MERSSKGVEKEGVLPNKAVWKSYHSGEREGLWASIPRKKELGKGLLLQIILDCGLTKNEFLDLL